MQAKIRPKPELSRFLNRGRLGNPTPPSHRSFAGQDPRLPRLRSLLREALRLCDVPSAREYLLAAQVWGLDFVGLSGWSSERIRLMAGSQLDASMLAQEELEEHVDLHLEDDGPLS